jgi:hypothetical protein
MKYTCKLFALIPLLILSLLARPANAQLEKGRWQLGYDLNQLSYQKEAARNTSTKFLVSPSVGYVPAKNLLVSLGIPVGFSNSSVFVGSLDGSPNGPLLDYVERHVSLGLSAAMRYHLGGSAVKPFVGFSYSYLVNKNTYGIEKLGGLSTANDESSLFTPSIGLMYSVTRRVGIMANVNYLITKNHLDQLVIPGSQSNAYVSRPDTRSLSVGLGVQLFLGK